jgi:hypothetical protein
MIFNACKSITWVSGRELGHENLEFFWPEWHSPIGSMLKTRKTVTRLSEYDPGYLSLTAYLRFRFFFNPGSGSALIWIWVAGAHMELQIWRNFFYFCKILMVRILLFLTGPQDNRNKGKREKITWKSFLKKLLLNSQKTLTYINADPKPCKKGQKHWILD